MKLYARQFLLSIFALLYFSNAHPQTWSWVQDNLYLNPSGVQIESPVYWAWGDVNNDGLVDIIISKFNYDYCCVLKAYAGTDRSRPPYWIESPELLAGLEGFHFGPIAIVDLDGAVNFVTFARDFGSQTAHSLIYWQKDSNGLWQQDTTFFDGIGLQVSSSFEEYFSFADVDADGDNDFLLSTPAGFFGGLGLHFFENIGTVSSPAWKEDSTRVEAINQNPAGYTDRSPIFIDGNFDSILDVVFVFVIEGAANVAIAAGVQDSMGIRWQKPELLLNLWQENGVGWLQNFDLNGDGFDDLLAAFSPRKAREDPLYFNPAFADLDADGDPDMLLAETLFSGPDSGLAKPKFFENTFLADSVVWLARADWGAGLEGQKYYQPAFADLDRDGDFDLVLGRTDSTLAFYRNIGTQQFPAWQIVTDGLVKAIGPLAPSFADVDNDGDADLLVGSRYDPDMIFRYYGLDFYRNETIVGISETAAERPVHFQLYQNYPNPFNASTAIRYDLPEAAFVTIMVYDLAGHLVAQLIDGDQNAGEHIVIFDASDLASGIYFYTLTVKNMTNGKQVDFRRTRKFVVVK